MSEAEKQFAQFVQQWWYSEGAYAMVQATKPQSLAYGLNESPVGLAAWILSFGTAGASPEQLEKAFGGRDEMLTNIMIYWFSQTVATSMSMYKVDATAQWGKAAPLVKTNVQAGVAVFPREAQFPKEWAERFVNVVSFNKMEDGGHFAALEVPVAFADELRRFFYSIKIAKRKMDFFKTILNWLNLPVTVVKKIGCICKLTYKYRFLTYTLFR